MTTFPDYEPPSLNQLPEEVQHLLPRLQKDRDNNELRLELETALTQHRIIQLQLQMEGIGGDPVYSCPKCRQTVQTRPVEVFRLKALVRAVEEAKGTSIPETSAAGRREGKMRSAPQCSPWDGFFGPDLDV